MGVVGDSLATASRYAWAFAFFFCRISELFVMFFSEWKEGTVFVLITTCYFLCSQFLQHISST